MWMTGLRSLREEKGLRDLCVRWSFWEVCFKEGAPNKFNVASEGPLLHCQFGYLEGLNC